MRNPIGHQGRSWLACAVFVVSAAAILSCDASRVLTVEPPHGAPLAVVNPSQYAHFYIVAHQDDWQLFMGEHTGASASTANEVVIINTTAGDAGEGTAYWTTREVAARASVDTLLHSTAAWSCGSFTLAGHVLNRCIKGKAVMYNMRLPDGNPSGYGYAGRGSMGLLRDGDQSTLQSLDLATTYTSWTDLWSTVRAIVDYESSNQSAPYVEVHAQEYDRNLNPNDHSDHLATADAVRAASLTRSWNLTWHVDYDIDTRPVNLTQALHDLKQQLFLAQDSVMSAANYGSAQNDPGYNAWLWRSYSRRTSPTDPPPAPPAAPTSLAATVVSATQLRLDWVDNATNEYGFYIERAPNNNGVPGTFAQVGSVAANVTTYTSTGLAANTRYWYRIRAFGEVDVSGYSNQANATTAILPATPTALTAAALSATQIKLTWTDNATNETGFRIDRALDNNGSPGSFTQVTTVAANITTYTHTGLNPNTRYWYRVRAFNATDNGAYSTNANTTTAALPATPTALAAAPVSPNQINLTWTDNATNETGYTVERAPDNAGVAGTFASIASLAANTTAYSNTGLTVNTRYWYRVRAFNATDNGAYSAVANATTTTVPAVPTAFVATAVSPTQINLTWTDNASNETGYTVEQAPDVAGAPGTFAALATLAANATSYSNTGLTPSTRYWYRVRAFTATDVSAFAGPTSATTLTPPPGAPTNLAATAQSVAQIDLTWTDNATTETGFTVERAPDNAGVPGTYAAIATLAADAVTYSNTGLTANTRYWYRVRAMTGTVPSANSNETSATTLQGPPATPSGLTATATSVSQINLTWTDNATFETGYTVEQAPDVSGAPGTFAPLATLGANATSYSNTALDPSTRYWYRVRAFTATDVSGYVGPTSATTFTPPPPPPVEPSNLAAVAPSASQIDLTWTDNAINETGYTVERAPDNAGSPGAFSPVATLGAGAVTYSNVGLAPGTRYWYRVRAFNTGGQSPYCSPSSAATLTIPPATPTLLVATATSVSQINLTWTDNATNETGYTVEQAPDVGGSPGTFAPLATLGVNATSYSNTGLTSSTRYWYRVRSFTATDVSSYAGPTSATTFAPPPPPPAAPANLVAGASSPSQIDLTWTDNATNETGYTVERAPDNGGVPGTYSPIATLGANAGSYSNTGLTQNTRYWYRVRAFNGTDVSGYSNETSATTPTAPPAAPSALSATATSMSQMNLTWTDNATNETGYTVEQAPDVGGSPGTFVPLATLGVNATSYSNTGLSSSTRYWYRVRAFTATDVSNYAGPTSATTFAPPPPPPVAPANLVAGAASPSQIDLTWTDNAANETGYTVERALDNGGVAGAYSSVATLGANAASYSNTGLAQNTRYWYRVRAFNGTDVSGYSNETSATTPTAPPATPTGLTATATSMSQINLAWTDNATNETGYTVEQAPDVGGSPGTFVPLATLGVNATSYSNTGLSSSTRYWYRVRAFTATDVSSYAGPTSATTFAPPPPPPGAPANLVAGASSPSQINLTWTDNATNETGYTVERAPDIGGVAGTYSPIATLGANAASYSNTGLAQNTRYWYRVRAFNGTDVSGYSNETSATTPTAPPAAPSALSATATSTSQINLAWTDNATNETGYAVEQAPDVSGAPGAFAPLATLGANATSYSNTGLTASTRYWYRVRAFTATDFSAYSSTASATTLAPPPPVPTAPTNLVATAASATQINLTWTDNATNETAYTVERAPDNAGAPGTFATIATLGANVVAYNNTGLTANTRYWYRVRASNGGGASGYSNQTSATTLGTPPAAPTTLTATVASSSQINLAWADKSNNETGFTIERAPDNAGAPGTFAAIATVAVNVKTYADLDVLPSTRYWYRVRAFNATDVSAYSNQVSGTTPAGMAAPTNVVATAVALDRITLTWTDNSTNEYVYVIERAPDNAGVAGTFVALTYLAPNSTTFTDTGLAAGTRYWYRVRPYTFTTAGPPSAAVSATTPTP